MPATTSKSLPICAAAFLAGNCLLFFMPTQSAACMLFVALVPVLILLSVLKIFHRPAVIFMAGFAWAALFTNHQLAVSLPSGLTGKTITVTGNIEGLPVHEGRAVRFNLKVFHSDLLQGKQQNKQINTTFRGVVHVSDYRSEPINPQPGEAWRLLLRVKPPHGFSNPAGFDYEKWLFSQRIIATAYIREDKNSDEKHAGFNHRLPELDTPAIIDVLRLRLASHISESLPGSVFAGIITALASGDRRSISQQQWRVLQKTGTSHLMAISGLHVGLVAGIAFIVFRLVWSVVPVLPIIFPAHKSAAIAALLLATFYSLLAGFSLPTQRALLMLSLLCLALLCDRRVRPLDILSLALLIVLVLDPLSLLSAGFWLSFSAVAMILYILLFRRQRAGAVASRITRSIRLQWQLSLMMAPISLLFFQQIPLAGPPANLVAIPVVAFLIVPIILLASLSYLLLGTGAVEHNLYLLAESVLELLWYLLDYMAAANDALSFAPAQSIVALAGILFAVFVMILPAGLKLGRLALVGLLVFFFPSHSGPGEGEFHLILLDVGQGLSAIIMTAEHTLLFDAGARFSEQFNAGDAVVLPVLKSLSVSRLDSLIVSHGDNDHSGGVQAVLTGINVSRVITNEPLNVYAATIETIDKPIDKMKCQAGLQWQWDGVLFRILHPGNSSSTGGNNASCVLQVSSPHGSVMLPADIEQQAEQEIVSRYPAVLASNVLVAPHHGSKTSSSERFIDVVSPQLVLFPAGWMNRYRHPAESVVNDLANRGIARMSTGECGSISVYVEQSGISVETQRQSDRAIWENKETDGRCRKIAIGLPEIPAL